MLNNYVDTNMRRNINAVQQSYVDDLMRRERARMNEYIKAREYYDGIQNSQMTDRHRQYLRVTQDVEFTVNYCSLVVNAKADRLKVTAFETEDESEQMLWEWWRKNRADKLQGIVHKAAVRDGDAFVLVEWDNNAKLPRFYFEPAYAGDGVMVYYSDERRTEIEFASKHWQIRYGPSTGKKRRLNLYFPDRIEKYISNDDQNAGQWLPFEDENNKANEIGLGRLGQTAITWWTDTGAKDGEPLGIPIIHFKNGESGDCYGTSHLANVMPIQDAVNKSMLDLLGAMDTAGFPLLVGLGTTDWVDLKVAPGAIAAVNQAPSEASLSRLEGTDPQGLLNVYNSLVMEIGRVSGTPLSYFQSTGHVASEGTMKQQEIALITQVKQTQVDFGNSWEDVMIVARRLHNVFGDGEKLDPDVLIDTIWQDAETRNDKLLAETLAIEVGQLGVSEEQAQIKLGYNATERLDMAREKKKQQTIAIREMARNNAMNNPQNNSDDQTLNQTENQNSEQPRAPTT